MPPLCWQPNLERVFTQDIHQIIKHAKKHPFFTVQTSNLNCIFHNVMKMLPLFQRGSFWSFPYSSSKPRLLNWCCAQSTAITFATSLSLFVFFFLSHIIQQIAVVLSQMELISFVKKWATVRVVHIYDTPHPSVDLDFFSRSKYFTRFWRYYLDFISTSNL